MNVLNWQRSLHLVIHILPFLCHEVAANTEIITFSSSREPTANLTWVGNWSTLRPTDNERQWSLEPSTALHTPLHHACERTDETRTVASSHPPFSCPHELWLFLDLDDETWASHPAFTLRLSWPASTPADVAITLYTPQDVLARRCSERASISSSGAHASATSTPTPTPHALTTRSRYARIRAVHAGVPTPGSRSTLAPDRVTAAAAATAARRVPLVVILEPVYGGVLPATLLPTVGFLVVVVLAAIGFVPWVTAYLELFVRQAREDLKTGMTRANKER